MSTTNTLIQLKKSGVSGNVPSSLQQGELGINYADGVLYYQSSSGLIKSISGSGGNTFSTINVSSSLIFASSNNDILSLVAGNNVTLTANTVSKSIIIDASGTGGTTIVSGFPYIDLGLVSDTPASALFDAGTLS
jgi:hypothetical protein